MYTKNEINFLNEEHCERFMKLNAGRQFDNEYSSCFYILSSSAAIYEKAKGCICKDGIKVNSLIRKPYSTSEAYMVKIAIAIFNKINDLKLDFHWVVRLDNIQYSVILEAFRLRRK